MPACPACGTALDDIGPQTRALDCPGCGHWVHASAGGWIDAGRLDGVLGAPAWLAVGRTLRLDGRALRIAGRVRLGHERGHRDEWWLVPSSGNRRAARSMTEGSWLEENEGRYLLHRAVDQRIPPEALRGVTVGRSVEADGASWVVTEDYESEVLGAEGELPRAFGVGARVRRLEAVGSGWRVSLELWPDGVAVSAAEPLVAGRLELEPR